MLNVNLDIHPQYYNLHFAVLILGPWFRMSNISYPEVTDSQQAIKDLTGI
jgi:hypothetical protein